MDEKFHEVWVDDMNFGGYPILQQSTIKMSYQYWKSHCGNKIVLKWYDLHYGISYPGKMTYSYWISLQVSKSNNIYLECPPYCYVFFQGSYGIVKLAYNEEDDVHYVSTRFL